MNKEIFIAFATQKGGIGKTTLTVLTASYLHYVKGYNVAVVDCDAPQNSIADLRAREVKVIDESTYFKALACDHFRRVKKKAYPVIASNAVNALDDADKMLRAEATKPDLVFFDLPGTLKSEGVVKTLSQMDYIFAPISADRLVVESSLQFIRKEPSPVMWITVFSGLPSLAPMAAPRPKPMAPNPPEVSSWPG